MRGSANLSTLQAFSSTLNPPTLNLEPALNLDIEPANPPTLNPPTSLSYVAQDRRPGVLRAAGFFGSTATSSPGLRTGASCLVARSTLTTIRTPCPRLCMCQYHARGCCQSMVVTGHCRSECYERCVLRKRRRKLFQQLSSKLDCWTVWKDDFAPAAPQSLVIWEIPEFCGFRYDSDARVESIVMPGLSTPTFIAPAKYSSW
ncbi:hypothetical protein HPB50_028316 [Hyalomma asiaticum]|nr:hypothetical protein HPB50_028316 [Hyalomma asiaticum]